MLIANYNEWLEKTSQELEASEEEVDCPGCQSWGCPSCDFTGEVPFLSLTNFEIRHSLLTKRVYFKEVIGDLKRYCAYTGSNFLEVVAPFIQEFRGQAAPYPRVSYHGPD